MAITQADADLLESIAREFSENIKRTYKKGDAVKAFNKAVRLTEMPKLASAMLRAEQEAHAAPEPRARALMNLCAAALPVLKRTFGEEFLIAALPEKARNQHVIDVCAALGGSGVADLCRKAMGHSP